MITSPIREIREAHDLTQLELAIIAGVAQSLISKMELGGADLNNRVKKALKQLAEDPDDAERRQDDFRRRTRRRLKNEARRQTAAPVPLPCDGRPKKSDGA